MKHSQGIVPVQIFIVNFTFWSILVQNSLTEKSLNFYNLSSFKSDVVYFTFWSITTAFLASFQGFFASLFYCFCNKEVNASISGCVQKLFASFQVQKAVCWFYFSLSLQVHTSKITRSFEALDRDLMIRGWD